MRCVSAFSHLGVLSFLLLGGVCELLLIGYRSETFTATRGHQSSDMAGRLRTDPMSSSQQAEVGSSDGGLALPDLWIGSHLRLKVG